MNHPDPGQSEPEWERLNESERVSDDDWNSVVAGFDSPPAVNSEMPADLVADEISARYDNWQQPPPPEVGWRHADPLFVLAVIAVLGGIATLLIGALFFRPMPGWLVLVLICCVLAGGLLLFRRLPNERRDPGDDGASV